MAESAERLGEAMDDRLAVRVRDLAVTGLLDGVSFDLLAGQCVAILEEDDVRRTALLECIAGVRRPDAGSVRAPAAAATWHEDGLAEQTAVIDSVADWIGNADAARELLDRLSLAHRAGHEPWAMSMGERRRIAAELALSSGRALIVLDEPERGLDQASLGWLAGRIREVRDAGATIVLATYNERLADEVADVVVDEL